MERKSLEELKRYRKMLYTIDMVNGFVRKGILSDLSIKDAIPEQTKLIERFIKEQQGIGFVRDEHTLNAIEFKTFPKHCVIGSGEELLVDELRGYESYGIDYPKNSTSAMFANNMMIDLEHLENLEEVVGCGCLTHICVPNFLIPLKCYFNQQNRDVKVFVVKDATRTLKNEYESYNEEISYYLMEQNGIHVVKDLEELEIEEKRLGLYLGGK